jgi:signal peptide peptidase SppA
MEPTTRTYERLIRFVCEQPWAVLPSTLALMRSILRMRAAGFKFTAEEIAERIGKPEARTGPAPREPGQIAVIPVWGLIGHRANELRDISSAVGTSTEILGAQIEAAIADPAVTSIVLDIDSPGGGVFGVEEVATTIRAARAQKPIIAVSNALAASAAYWIASAASEVVVTPSGLVGSIGVYSMHEDHSKELAEAGIDVTLIRAGKFKAEDNPFGPLTDAARAAIQERVDAYYTLFTRDVAKGRGASIDAVRNGFGEGRVVGAKEAVDLGLADRVATMDDVLADLVAGKVPSVGRPRAQASDENCPTCNGSGLKPERFMGDPQGQEDCPDCAGSGKRASVKRPAIAAEVEEIADIRAEIEPNSPIRAELPAREETADERARRLRLRLLELS